MRISDWSSDVCSSDLTAGWLICMARAAPATEPSETTRRKAGNARMFMPAFPQTVCHRQLISAAYQVITRLYYRAAPGFCMLPATMPPHHNDGSAHPGVKHGVQIGRASCRERVCQYV